MNVSQSNHWSDANKISSIAYEVLCHCERSVAISRKGNLVKKWLKFVAEKFGFFGFGDEI